MSLKKLKDLFNIGEEYYFEYHCLEAHYSADAELWYRSHQKVIVLEMETPDFDPSETFKERAEEGMPLVYLVKFPDGLIRHVMEDELMRSSDEFYRTDPPKKNNS